MRHACIQLEKGKRENFNVATADFLSLCIYTWNDILESVLLSVDRKLATLCRIGVLFSVTSRLRFQSLHTDIYTIHREKRGREERERGGGQEEMWRENRGKQEGEEGEEGVK